ncbi:MAG TPA: glycosyltransferase family 4 protein [Ignavibacteriales bacterium]|nr:glycosyltransferase family 4 protein [Ignavibacteriales bacterium]HRR17586.1 glycosyltransferase family 4 protein [Ignavibacteriales bacterium]
MKNLYLALSYGENFGWGVCSKYLKQEITKQYPNTFVLDNICKHDEIKNFDGIMFHALVSHILDPLFKARANINIGYCFFEQELNEQSKNNAKNYDLILGGSTWNEKKLKAAGIPSSGTLIQGIDPDIFNYQQPKDFNHFVIFSGGKFELRKAQDVVIKAVAHMQKKFPDVVLVNAWFNMWPQTMLNMASSKHIKFNLRGNNYLEMINNILVDNNIDLERTITLELIDNKKLPEIYRLTDIGLFPNRCEGGTNLVLMEYLASGRPAIATYETGHKDVLNENIAYLLKKSKGLQIYNGNILLHDWVEPDIDEVIDKLEYAYYHRQENVQKGMEAANFMKNFTWQKSASTFLESIKPFL